MLNVVAALSITGAAIAQIDTVSLMEAGRYQHPYVIGSISSSTYSCRIDRLDRPYVYMACWNLGLVTLDITDPSQPVPVDTLTQSELGGLNAMNVEQRGAILYLPLGGFNDDNQGTGFATVDASDPQSLNVLDRWDGGSEFTTGAAIVVLDEDVAYLGGMEEGIASFDISDPSSIAPLGTFLPDVSWPGLVAYPPNARGMAVKDDVLYLCFDAGALRAIDVSDPSSMSQLGQYLNPQQPALTPCAYNNVVIKGHHAFVTTDFCGFEVVDISDPTDMQQMNWTNPWNCLGGSWFGSDGHTNEAVLAMGDSLLFLSGGDSELLIYDITEPAIPQLVGGHILPNDTAAAWGVDVRGGLAASCLLNNSFIFFPPQPYYSYYGGLLLFEWTPEFTTGLPTGTNQAAALRVQPNPADEEVILYLREARTGPLRVLFCDSRGRTVDERIVSVRGTSLRLDVADIPPGAYVLRITGDTRFAQATVMLKR